MRLNCICMYVCMCNGRHDGSKCLRHEVELCVCVCMYVCMCNGGHDGSRRLRHERELCMYVCMYVCVIIHMKGAGF